MSSPGDGRAGPAEELRRRRTALGWTLEQVAAQAQVSVGMLSLIETGKRRPSLRSWERIRGALGISEPLSVEGLQQPRREITDGLVASLGACLAAVRQATLAELTEATGWPVSEVRLALRRLAEQLEATGMQVLDDGSHVQLAPAKRFHDAVAQLVQPERLPRLTQEQAEVLAIVIADGMATRRQIEEIRGAATLSIGPEGPVSMPRDSSETLALLLSRGLLCADRDDHGAGRPLVYRPTPRLLQLLRVETLEEARGRLGVPPGNLFSNGPNPGDHGASQMPGSSEESDRVKARVVLCEEPGDRLVTRSEGSPPHLLDFVPGSFAAGAAPLAASEIEHWAQLSDHECMRERTPAPEWQPATMAAGRVDAPAGGR